MRKVQDIIELFDPANEKENRKIKIIEWFQKHPEKRFDRMEVAGEIGDELGVGQKTIGSYLEELTESEIMESHGEKRISYTLADDIYIPIKYQALAGLRHVRSIYDIKRWGVAGFIVISTTAWFFLTVPFWFFSLFMLLTPMDHIGTLGEYDIYIMAVGMTAWLFIIIGLSFVVYRLQELVGWSGFWS